MIMNSKMRIILSGLAVILAINHLFSKILLFLDRYSGWYVDYDVEITNLVFIFRILISIFIIIHVRKLYLNHK